MISQTWWYVARASGIVAWGFGVASVLWGTLLATRLLGKRPRGPWLLDLHRFLGGATVLFVGLHIGALVADSYEQFGLADVLVPFASGYKSLAVALGIVAMWLLLAVELSSLVMKRLPKKVWHTIHLSSYAVAFLTSVHLLAGGTDAGNPVLKTAALVWMPIVVGLLVYRWLAPPLAPARPARSASPASASPAPGAPTPVAAPAAPPASAYGPASVPTGWPSGYPASPPVHPQPPAWLPPPSPPPGPPAPPPPGPRRVPAA